MAQATEPTETCEESIVCTVGLVELYGTDRQRVSAICLSGPVSATINGLPNAAIHRAKINRVGICRMRGERFDRAHYSVVRRSGGLSALDRRRSFGRPGA